MSLGKICATNSGVNFSRASESSKQSNVLSLTPNEFLDFLESFNFDPDWETASIASTNTVTGQEPCYDNFYRYIGKKVVSRLNRQFKGDFKSFIESSNEKDTFGHPEQNMQDIILYVQNSISQRQVCELLKQDWESTQIDANDLYKYLYRTDDISTEFQDLVSSLNENHHLYGKSELAKNIIEELKKRYKALKLESSTDDNKCDGHNYHSMVVLPEDPENNAALLGQTVIEPSSKSGSRTSSPLTISTAGDQGGYLPNQEYTMTFVDKNPCDNDQTLLESDCKSNGTGITDSESSSVISGNDSTDPPQKNQTAETKSVNTVNGLPEESTDKVPNDYLVGVAIIIAFVALMKIDAIVAFLPGFFGIDCDADQNSSSFRQFTEIADQVEGSDISSLSENAIGSQNSSGFRQFTEIKNFGLTKSQIDDMLSTWE